MEPIVEQHVNSDRADLDVVVPTMRPFAQSERMGFDRRVHIGHQAQKWVLDVENSFRFRVLACDPAAGRTDKRARQFAWEASR